MKTVNRGTATLTLQLAAILVFASFVTLARAEDASVEALKAGIEGVYVLQEWHRDGEILRPPLIDGRSVLLDNRLMFIVHDRSQGTTKTTLAGYATYILEAGNSRTAMSRGAQLRTHRTEQPSQKTYRGKDCARTPQASRITRSIFAQQMDHRSFGLMRVVRHTRMGSKRGCIGE